MRFGGAGEGALLVAEQDALDQVLRDGAAIDGDEGPARRSLSPWMARAIISLPTPHFAFDQDRDVRLGAAAAQRADILHGRGGGDQVGEGELPAGLLLEALLFLEGIDPSRFCIDTLRRSGLTGLTTKSSAPARIALTTVSIEPCAVWTMTGMRLPMAVEPRQQLEAVHARHDEIEHDQIDRPGPRLGEKIERRRRAVGEQRVMAATADHAVQETPLGRIVVNDENAMGHGNSLACQSCRSIGHAIGQDHLRPLARPIAVIWWSRHWQRSVKRLLMTRRIETVRCPG